MLLNWFSAIFIIFLLYPVQKQQQQTKQKTCGGTCNIFGELIPLCFEFIHAVCHTLVN